MMNDYKRLIKNLVALGVIGLFIVLAVYYFSSLENEQKKIADSPIRIESIRTIAEISTVSYKDEVVIDSIEYYDGVTDLLNPLEWPEVVDRAINHNTKRRLTLIIRGEVKYGLNLTDHNYTVKSNEDSIWLTLPDCEILDVVLTPSKTEVFHEQGTWNDGTRKQMELLAKEKLKQNAIDLNLKDKANENAEQLFNKLIRSKRKLIIDFE